MIKFKVWTKNFHGQMSLQIKYLIKEEFCVCENFEKYYYYNYNICMNNFISIYYSFTLLKNK